MAPLPDLPNGFVARGMREDDVAAVTALIAACELADVGAAEIAEDDIAMSFGRSDYDPERDTVLVFDGDTLVAWADVYASRAEVDVAPTHRGRAIGSALLAWTERRAKELGTTTVRQIVADGTDRIPLLTAAGYEPGHVAWVLQIGFEDGPPVAPVVPEGITIRAYDPERDAPRAYRVIEDAFNEWEGREPTTYETWRSFTVDHGSFAPAMSCVALDGDLIVGAALALDYAEHTEGWIQQVATVASYRGRGIARAMLQTTFRAFYDRGQKRCDLSTDSRTGALGLYERVGMRVRRSYTNFTRSLEATRRSGESV